MDSATSNEVIMANIREYDLGQQKRGATAIITLKGNAANVRLLDRSNLNSFKNGRSHRAYGAGLVTRSPHRIVIPSDGRWYVTVDLIGMAANARVSSAVQIEPPPLQPARSADAPLSGVAVNPSPPIMTEDGGPWDVFLSHASEDKVDIAEPLYDALTTFGLTVWFDQATLRIGDSLRRKIDEGLKRSAFGVVIFSQAFFAKSWPQYELDGIVTQTLAGQQNLLPIWHRLTEDEMRTYSPSLADKVARNTATSPVTEIAEEIARRVRPDLFED
jgi:hypothetical protein